MKYEPRSQHWRIKETRTCKVATYRMGSFAAHVIDRNGDASEWSVSRYGQMLQFGTATQYRPTYHFDLAVQLAERALVQIGALVKDEHEATNHG